MTAHKNAEMIKAKADNMELVVFGKLQDDEGSSWVEVIFNGLVSDSFFDYFLCLPQHKEACLHWLNGGDVQLTDDSGNGGFTQQAPDFTRWHPEKWFMNSLSESRIKPQSEKRWIGVHESSFTTNAFMSKNEAIMASKYALSHLIGDYYNHDDWQYIEIEVEV